MGPTNRLLGASWIDGPTFRIAVISCDDNALRIIGNVGEGLKGVFVIIHEDDVLSV